MKRKNDDAVVTAVSSHRPRTKRASAAREDEQAHDSPDTPEQNKVKSADGKGKAPVILNDRDVLHCVLCFEPLTVEVFQCENGHVAYSSCHGKIGHECPSCKLPISYRCRGLEKVLNAATRACENSKHGYQEEVVYRDEALHKTVCEHKALSCPFAGCSFESSCKKLNRHLTAKHKGSIVSFPRDNFFKVKLDAGSKSLVLREEKGEEMFLLSRREHRTGSVLRLSLLSPDPSKVVKFDVRAKGKSGTMLSLLSMLGSDSQADNDIDLSSQGFFVIPLEFFASGEFAFNLNICKSNE